MPSRQQRGRPLVDKVDTYSVGESIRELGRDIQEKVSKAYDTIDTDMGHPERAGQVLVMALWVSMIKHYIFR